MATTNDSQARNNPVEIRADEATSTPFKRPRQPILADAITLYAARPEGRRRAELKRKGQLAVWQLQLKLDGEAASRQAAQPEQAAS